MYGPQLVDTARKNGGESPPILLYVMKRTAQCFCPCSSWTACQGVPQFQMLQTHIQQPHTPDADAGTRYVH